MVVPVKKASLHKRKKMVNSRQEVLDYICTHKDALRRNFHIRKIALIGSFARNAQTPDSDIDLLLDIEEGTPDLYRLKRDLKQDLELEFGRSVDLVAERYLKPYFREQVLRDAIYV